MGCFYVGFDYLNRKNGYLKIGETGKNSPSARIANIHQTDAFQCLEYLILPDSLKVERLFIEAYVRLELSRKFVELVPMQNDHFSYIISTDKYGQAQTFADFAIEKAIEICELQGFRWERGQKQFKRARAKKRK